MKTKKTNLISSLILGLIIILCSYYLVNIEIIAKNQEKIRIEEFNKQLDNIKVVEDKKSNSLSVANSLNRSVGILSIPSIGLNTTIYDNSLEKSLNNGCGIIEGTGDILDTKNQNTILTSHNGSSVKDLFTNLEKMNVNDKFYIKSNDKKIREYLVIDKKVVSPANELNYVKKPNKDLKYVTLRTCTPTGINSHRLHVVGVFNKEIKKIPSPKFILSKFEIFLIIIFLICLLLLISNIRQSFKNKRRG